MVTIIWVRGLSKITNDRVTDMLNSYIRFNNNNNNNINYDSLNS